MAERALTIGEVATRSGVSRRALRLYEARGIVPKPRRTQAGYRVYDADVLGILHFVTQARLLGLTLKEIGHIIGLRSAKPGPCVHVRGLLEQKLVELDSLRREVKKILTTWDASSARRDFIFSSPPVPPDEEQIAPTFHRMAWEVAKTFDWAHIFHRSLYDLFASDRVKDKEAAYRKLLADYLEKL
jgi:MerR family transcriptional regulator, copper efflux regulator